MRTASAPRAQVVQVSSPPAKQQQVGRPLVVDDAREPAMRWRSRAPSPRRSGPPRRAAHAQSTSIRVCPLAAWYSTGQAVAVVVAPAQQGDARPSGAIAALGQPTAGRRGDGFGELARRGRIGKCGHGGEGECGDQHGQTHGAAFSDGMADIVTGRDAGRCPWSCALDSCQPSRRAPGARPSWPHAPRFFTCRSLETLRGDPQ